MRLARPELFLFALPLLWDAGVASALDEAEVLRRHVAARGGAAAIEAIESVDVTVTIDEGWVAEGRYRAVRSGSMRIDVSIDGERVFTEGLHDGAAWAMRQGETSGSPITDEEARILWRGVLGNLYGLHEYEDQGVEVTVSGPEQLEDRSYWVVDLLHEDGFADRYYLDADTYLIARQRSDHALHPAADPEKKRFETRYSDYRRLGGVLSPFLVEKFDLATGERVQRTEVRAKAVNAAIEGAIFRRPGGDRR